MVSLFLMRRLTDYYSSSIKGEWELTHFTQYSLKDSRITVLGTGDIGCEFAKRARAFEPAKIVGISRSGVCSDTSFDEMHKIDALDELYNTNQWDQFLNKMDLIKFKKEKA